MTSTIVAQIILGSGRSLGVEPEALRAVVESHIPHKFAGLQTDAISNTCVGGSPIEIIGFTINLRSNSITITVLRYGPNQFLIHFFPNCSGEFLWLNVQAFPAHREIARSAQQQILPPAESGLGCRLSNVFPL